MSTLKELLISILYAALMVFGLALIAVLLHGEDAPPSALKIIRERCVKCHSGDKPPNGLRLDSVDNMVRGGKRGPALVPFKPDESLIYQALNGAPGAVWNSKGFVIMPPGSQLSTEEIITIRKWIVNGAMQFSMSGREP